MPEERDLSQSAFLAHVAQHLGGSARAILGFQELAIEQARELGLSDLLPDLEKVSGAAGDLNRLLDRMLGEGFEVGPSDAASFGATLRHDLRTPLNAIIGYSEMIAEELSELPHDSLRGDVAVILAEAAALLDRIDEIVDFSEVKEAGSAPAAAEALDVAQGIAAAIDREPGADEGGRGRILVIDDVASNRQLLARRLSRDGHHVFLAESGAQGLEILAASEVDVILLDILMPDMNGIELLSRIRREPAWRQTPVIMISSLREMEAVIRCVEAGADDYLSKPFDPVLLRARIRACLDKKRWLDREQSYLRRIEVERERADALLHAILPSQVVARLKNGEEIIADRFDSVTILFADLVGFTPVAARLSPTRLVQRLDQIFRAFDVLAERHGVEKIKTIGDAYMAAAGVPEPTDDHAERVVCLGRSMLETMGRIETEEVPFRIRIGIHTGPVVAGLLGRHRFVYDVWGETVNVASRLEAHGVPNMIQLSEATLRALKSSFPVERRGMIALKGMAGMTSFLLAAGH